MNGRTPREILIELSERFYKQIFGDDCWARWLNQTIAETRPERVAVADLGFQCEIDTLAAAAERTVLVRLARPGRTFARDSRRYVVPVPGVETFEIGADTYEELIQKADAMMRVILSEGVS